MEIWTDEEQLERASDNLYNHFIRGIRPTCKTCNWGGCDKDDYYVTCGHHNVNLTASSWCDYWTDEDDPKLKAYNEKRKKEFLERKAKKHE